MMHNSLMLDRNTARVSRQDLMRVPTPYATPTWRPVPHHRVAELVVNEAETRGYCIVSEEYGLNPAGTKLFGVLRFHPQGRPEFSRALGLRNSHDKSLALGLTVGVSVMVCANLAFGGETTVTRKHTSGIEVDGLVPWAFDQLAPQYERLETNIERMKGKSLSLDAARLLAVKAAELDAIPSCDVVPVLKEYRSPRHEEFAPRTVWSLFNAFTELAKKYSPPRADKCYRQLAGMFDLD